MFRDAVREFAETEVRPHVQEMDEAAQFRGDLIPKFFELGLMGIEVPEQYGGAGRRDLHGGARHRGAGPGGRLGRDLRRRAQHPGQQRLSPLGQRRAEGALLPAAHDATCSAPSRSPSRAAAATPSPSPPGPSEGADGWELTGRKFWITNGAEAGFFIVFANTDLSKGYKGITAFIVEREFSGFASARRRTSSASAPRARRS